MRGLSMYRDAANTVANEHESQNFIEQRVSILFKYKCVRVC
jgi:hypothetical protein